MPAPRCGAVEDPNCARLPWEYRADMPPIRCSLCDRLMMMAGDQPPTMLFPVGAPILCEPCDALPPEHRKQRRNQVMARQLLDDLRLAGHRRRA